VEEFDSLDAKSFDCCLNIDSFAEMDAEIVHFYLDYIRSHCAGFSLKNPVASTWTSPWTGTMTAQRPSGWP
jgi:hypothetical protein